MHPSIMMTVVQVRMTWDDWPPSPLEARGGLVRAGKHDLSRGGIKSCRASPDPSPRPGHKASYFQQTPAHQAACQCINLHLHHVDIIAILSGDVRVCWQEPQEVPGWVSARVWPVLRPPSGQVAVPVSSTPRQQLSSRSWQRGLAPAGHTARLGGT